MSGSALEVREGSARYIVRGEVPLVWGFELLTKSQGGVDSLRELILSLAVRGLLVRQSADDAPGSAIVRAMRQTKAAVSDARMTKRDERLASFADDDLPYGTPTGWAWVRLGELLTKFGAGSTPLGGREVYTTAGVKFLRSQNVWNHGLALGGVAFIPTAVHEKMGGTKVFAGDLLFNITGASIGRCALVPESFDEGNVSQHVTILRTALPSIRPFLHLVLISARVQQTVRDVQVGVSREGLSIAKLGQFVVPLPPLAEQHRIVARVEELMKLCDALEQSGRLADEQHARLTSTLFDALAASESADALAENWQRIAEHFDLLLDRPEAIAALEQTILQLAVRGLLVPQDSRDALDDGAAVSLGDAGSIRNEADDVNPELPTSWSRVSLGSITRDLRYGTSAKCAYESVGAPVLRIPNLCSGRVLVSDLKFGALSADEVRRLRLEVGDLLIIRSNGSASLVGSAAIVGKEAYGFAFAGYLMRLRLREEWATPSFVLLTLETAAVRSQIERPLRTTSGVKNINSTEVANIRLSLPPLAEQHRIVARVEELRLLCTQLRERLSAARRTQSQLADALVAEVLA